MSTTLISRGEADAKARELESIDREIIVTVKNRFGRLVDIPRYNAKKMVLRREGEIISDPSPDYAELLVLKEKYAQKFGNEPKGEWGKFILLSKLSNSSEDKKALTEQYVIKFGKKPFAGWDEETLKEKLS